MDPPSRRQLARGGFHVLSYQLIKQMVTASRATGVLRSSLGNPAAGILRLFRRHPRIAVLGVTGKANEDLRLLFGYVLEPAFRSGCTLLISADRHLNELATLVDSPQSVDPDWRYPWSLERVLSLAERGRTPYRILVPAPVTPWRRLWHRVSRWVGQDRRGTSTSRLDAEQTAAVQAGDGVVQVIAPAGSGKTTVLIERVKELQRRGTPTRRILCMSFNRAAKVEIGQRLARAGVDGVVVRSFHGMGLAILKEAGLLRSGIGGLEDRVLAAIIGEAIAEEPVDEEAAAVIAVQTKSFDVAAARNAISAYKLASMISPAEARLLAMYAGPLARITARVYQRYEQELILHGVLDFDDLVAEAVSLLQRDAVVRHQWQKRFERVLVDEYQDIEPSQALLVGILAAPEDSLFCVGDEDQCIYAWRRATVQRIIELDQVYPGLERYALIRNYRCGRRITEASRRLIEHNRIRFRKPLRAGARQRGEIIIGRCADRPAGAKLVAYLISDAVPDETVVLARTTRLLNEVVAACEGTPAVELATIHAAKGREWERVILFGIDEGQMPHAQALSENGLEDERRLFYVALTRAKQRLEIICTEGRESRFLAEAALR